MTAQVIYCAKVNVLLHVKGDIAMSEKHLQAYYYAVFLPRRLRHLRKLKNVSARKMSLDLEQNVNYINNIENGISSPSILSFFCICQYLQITPQEFFNFNYKVAKEQREVIELFNQMDHSSAVHILALMRSLTNK